MLKEFEARINNNRENIRKSFVETSDPLAGVKHYTPANLKQYEENLYKSFAQKEISEEELRTGLKAKDSLIQRSIIDQHGFTKVVFVEAPLEQIDLEKGVENELENEDEPAEEGAESDEEEGELQKSFSDNLEKGKALPIGTVHNGYKKVGDNSWKKVSSMGMTKKEHDEKLDKIGNQPKKSGDAEKGIQKEYNKHAKAYRETDDRDYSDADVEGKTRKVADSAR